MGLKRQLYRYDLIFEGKLRKGFTPEEVTRLLRDEVKLKDETISMLFARKAKVCKNADYETVLKWHKKFFSAGIDLKLKQAEKPLKHKIQNRQIRTMAKIKELPLASTIKDHPKNQNKRIRQDITLDVLKALFGRAEVRMDHSIQWRGAVLSAVLLLLIPLMYCFLLVGLLGLALWSIVDIKAYFGESLSWYLTVLVYALPLLAIMPLIGYLLSPLLAPPSASCPQELDSEQHVLLYGLVKLLCKKMSLRAPEKIYVDNDVDIRLDDFNLKSLYKKERSLTIGMPVIAALTIEQLVALLAYKLSMMGGGFDAFMYARLQRFDYWFYQPLFTNERLKKSSEQATGLLYKTAFALANYYKVNAIRMMRMLYRVHHRLVSFILKPVVLRSLGHAAQLLGRLKLEQSIFELKKLRYSQQEVHMLNQTLMRSKRFLDNIPLAIANFYFQYRVPIERKINEEAKGQFKRYVYLSDHFITQLSGYEKGFFQCTSPARILLSHFELFCNLLTSGYYRGNGVAEHDKSFISDAAMLAAGSIGNHTIKSLGTFFNGLFAQTRIFYLQQQSSHLTSINAYDHQTVIDRIRWKTLDFKSAVVTAAELKTKIELAKIGQSYLRAKVKIIADAYCLKGYDSKSTAATIALFELKLQKNANTLMEMDALFKKRIEFCVAKMTGVDKRNTVMHLRTLELMVQFIPVLDKAEQNIAILNALLTCTFSGAKEKLTDTIRFYLQRVKNSIKEIVSLSCNVRRIEGDATTQLLIDYLKIKLGNEIEQPLDIDADQSVQYARLLLRSVLQWYMAILAEVSARCEAVERSNLIKPLRLIV